MKKARSEEIDFMFDEGEDITEYMDMSTARRPNLETKTVNVQFPVWMIEELDRAADRLAINRQAVIKVWVADRIRSEKATA